MKFEQRLWRSAVVAAAFAPLLGIYFAAGHALSPDAQWITRAACTVFILVCWIPARMFSKCLLMVKKGEFVFAQLVEDGSTQLLQNGIHLLAALGTQTKTFPSTADCMLFGTITLVRVRPGKIGLGSDNGKPVFLLPGVHLYNAQNFEHQGSASITDQMIKNGPITIVRVSPGEVGTATNNGEPVLLEEGMHFIDQPAFIMGACKKVDEPTIEVGTTRIIVVPRGKIMPVLVNGEGHFLLQGRHFINLRRFQALGMKSEGDEYICAGTRHRVLISAGKVGLALEAGEPLLLEPGRIHLKHSSLFRYVSSENIQKQVITHLSFKIVTVNDGQYGISYKAGVIELLKPGRHYLTDPTHQPAGFISAGQQTLRISEVTGMSSDNVELRFDAAICMRVVDPVKAVVMLTQGKGDPMSELQANVQERAKLALAIIIGNNSLNKKHAATGAKKATGTEEPAEPSASEAAGDEDFEQVPDPLAKEAADRGGSFRQVLHDVFMHGFSMSMLNECGVQVIDMSIEDVVIVNQELATAMASAAVANSCLEKTTIESDIIQVRAAAEAKVAVIEARSKATAMEIIARAEADRIATIASSMDKACPSGQQLELVRTSCAGLSNGSTVMLAQDTGALATLLSGAQGSSLGPRLK